jgi:hypothetical protein
LCSMSRQVWEACWLASCPKLAPQYDTHELRTHLRTPGAHYISWQEPRQIAAPGGLPSLRFGAAQNSMSQIGVLAASPHSRHGGRAVHMALITAQLSVELCIASPTWRHVAIFAVSALQRLYHQKKQQFSLERASDASWGLAALPRGSPSRSAPRSATRPPLAGSRSIWRQTTQS